MGMILVTMEAQAPPELEETLTRAYAHVMRRRPDGILLSMLTQDSHDPTLWRILTVWESREAFEAHYCSSASMPSAYVFHLAGLAPLATLSEIVAYE